MRILSRVLGSILILCGVIALVVGIGVMALVGRDSRVPLGEQQWTSDGVAVVSSDGLFSVMGPTLQVEVTSRSEKPVFVGVGYTDDVSDYLSASSRTAISSWSPPGSFGTVQLRGEDRKIPGPDGLDWWVAETTGKGSAALDWKMVDGRYSFVIMNADGSPELDTTAKLKLVIEGLFETALLVAIGGLLGLLIGILSFVLTRRRTPKTPAAVQETPAVASADATTQQGAHPAPPPGASVPPGPPPGPPQQPAPPQQMGLPLSAPPQPPSAQVGSAGGPTYGANS
ncbi:MAG: hypothetical protein L0G99_08145 [Propionibacteriales bacterium]|nr:hypothetical protein [Propionibacteriales bacterium]